MIQTLYALGALSLVIVLTLQLIELEHRSQRKQGSVEAIIRLTGVAGEVLDHFETVPFDASKNPLALTPATAFGLGCTVFTQCTDLDDFHGKTVDVDRGGYVYRVSVVVRYVDEATGAVESPVPTRAKRVELTFHQPDLPRGADGSRSLGVSRLYIYPVLRD